MTEQKKYCRHLTTIGFVPFCMNVGQNLASLPNESPLKHLECPIAELMTDDCLQLENPPAPPTIFKSESNPQ